MILWPVRYTVCICMIKCKTIIIGNFVSKNVSWEVQKSPCYSNDVCNDCLNKGIVDAAKFAVTTTRSYMKMGLFILHCISWVSWLTQWSRSWIHQICHLNGGTLVVILTLYSMTKSFSCLLESTYIRMHTGRVHQISCCANGLAIGLSNETAHKWLHYFEFNMNDHHEGVFLDCHDQEDVVVYYCKGAHTIILYTQYTSAYHYHQLSVRVSDLC